MQPLLLIQNDELAVLVCLLQDVLALLNVAVVIFQAEQGRHQCHIGLNGITKCQHNTFPRLIPVRLQFPEEKDFEAQLKDLMPYF